MIKVKAKGLDSFQSDLATAEKQFIEGVPLVMGELATETADAARTRAKGGQLTGRSMNSIRAMGPKVRAGEGVPWYAFADFGGRVGRNRSVVRPFIKGGRWLFREVGSVGVIRKSEKMVEKSYEGAPMSKPIVVEFDGNATGAVKAFDSVGDSTKRMAKQVDDSATSHTRLGERIGGNEAALMGTADLLDGLGATFGVNTQGATALARGLGDLTGGFGVVSGIIPGVTSLFPKLAGAMTFISAHPLMIGILIGGAIIAGLILLEKKFGLVSGAVGALGGAMRAAWDNGIKPAINLIIGGVELLARAWAMPFTLLSKIPGIGNLVPDGLTNIKLPRLDVGGTVLQTGVAVVHRGEVVSPAGGSPSRSAGDTFIINVHGSVSSERDLVDAIHAGLLTKQRSGPLGIAA